MKIANITAENTQQTIISMKSDKNNQSPTNSTPLKQDKHTSLPSFHSLGMSLAFKGRDKAGSNIQKVMDDIANTKAIIESLEASTGTSKSKQQEEAYEKTRAYDSWCARKNSEYEYAKGRAESAQKTEENKHWGITNFFCSYGKDAYNAKMNELYWNLDRKYDLPTHEVEKYRAIIDAYENIANANETSRIAQIKVLKEKLVALEKNIDFASLQDEVNETMNNAGGVEDRIAGYEDVKEEIQRVFVEPLHTSVQKQDVRIPVPSAIMLYGATGCGKTTFLKAIEAQSKDDAEVIDISNGISSAGSFRKQLEEGYFKTAKQNYNQTGKRTIFLINEAERFLCMSEEDIGKSGMFLDASDRQKLADYNSEFECSKNVNFFKTVLDELSQMPSDDNPRGKAATIFITSNYPHLIHRDLLSRDGKYGKLMHIAVKPAADRDLRAVIQHYFKKHSDLLEKIKMYSKRDNYADLIRSIPGVSDKGKETLISKTKDGTIENMHIDPTCSEFPNFDAFIKGNNPSLVRGAYSNARIQNIADKAFVEYLKNPAVSYVKHFCNAKNERGQDISPEAYRYFKEIYDMVQNPEKFKANNDTTIAEDVNELKQAYLDGMLSEEEMKIFELKKQDIQRMYDELKTKPGLTEIERASMKQYKEFLDAVDSVYL